MTEKAPEKLVDKVVGWMIGDDAVLYKPVPPEIGSKHVTELMGRHPYHPYDPEMPTDHVCHGHNIAFGQCMDGRGEQEELHMKHVNCFHPMKVDLMKCLTKLKREARLAKEAAEAAGN